jgi:hypothetical protein
MNSVSLDFSLDEYAQRLAKVRQSMVEQGIDTLRCIFYVRYGVSVDHATLISWVVRYSPLIASEAKKRKQCRLGKHQYLDSLAQGPVGVSWFEKGVIFSTSVLSKCYIFVTPANYSVWIR